MLASHFVGLRLLLCSLPDYLKYNVWVTGRTQALLLVDYSTSRY